MIRLNRDKVKETQRDRALRNMRASLLLEKISEREGISGNEKTTDYLFEQLQKQA